MKLNVPIKLESTTRYYMHNRQVAIKDVFDGLVELITNSDDSYHRLFKNKLRPTDGGRILIETSNSRSNPLIIVRDRAEGMTLEVMLKKLQKVGEKSSESGDRGFMSRGAKDCTALGDVIFESIVNDKYYRASITYNADFIPEVDKNSATKEIRQSLHIEKGNGTVVTIKLIKSLPRGNTICTNLPCHFALRDILSEGSPSEVLFRDLNDKNSKPQRITYYQPEGEVVCKEDFDIKGYPNAKAKLLIIKASEPLEDISEKFRKSGLIIKGKRGIHECSLLQQSFERDNLGKQYFGRIECEYIDFLMEDYDKRLEKNEKPLIENPSLVIDPNRQYGLNRSHPFVTALLEVPTQRLKELIDTDRESAKKSKDDIVGEELRKRFDELAKAASKFLSEQIEDLDTSTDEQEIDDDAFAKGGILIFPTYANLAVDTVRSFGLYVERKIFNKEESEVSISSDNSAIEILNPVIKLVPHKKRKSLLYARFGLKGIQIKEGVCIETKCDGLPKAEALINVIENKIEEREFAAALEFEHKNYKIKDGSTKTITVFAKYPELVNSETALTVISNDNVSLPVKGKCVLIPVLNSNYARGEIIIEARRLVKDTITLSTELSDVKATAKVKVLQKEDKGLPIKIDFRDEDFGDFRSRWGDHEGKPYLLLISARHSSLKRYLGPAPDFEGRDSIHFRTILAEIVAESVGRKSLLMETKHHSWMFQYANYKEDALIAETVLSNLQKRIKEFLPIAHQIMIKNSELARRSETL